MKKAIVVLIIAALLGLGGVYAHSSWMTVKRAPQQQQKSQKDKKEQSRRVYKGRGNPRDIKLTEAAAKARGDLKTEIEIGLPSLEPFAPPSYIHDLLKRRGCDADAVMIATIKSEASFLTEDETFIYTNHKVRVEDVLKDNQAAPIHTDDTVTVTRTGGTLTLSGKKIVALDKNGLPLQLNKRYLLFLTYLPERDAYVADNISYLLENDKIVKTTVGQLAKEMESGNDATDFIQSARIALAESCPNTQGDTR